MASSKLPRALAGALGRPSLALRPRQTPDIRARLFASAGSTNTNSKFATLPFEPLISVEQYQINLETARRDRPQVPKPTPFVPDVRTLLHLIGRGLVKHVKQLPEWDELFRMKGHNREEKLAFLAPRNRRYLLEWLERFRHGEFGPGGDVKYVDADGNAELRALKIKKSEFGPRKLIVVNVPFRTQIADLPPDEPLVMPLGYTSTPNRVINGRFLQPRRGSGRFVIFKREGMWEDKLGVKIDGGERRRAEVRFKKGILERRARREAEASMA